MNDAANAKPFTVIGGFLGAGKTTLINRLLNESQGLRYALLVNDFGAINIDEKLVRSHDGQTLSLANGCICCSLADGFINTMLRLMQSPHLFDHIVVECSGVSRPDRIMDFARIDPALSAEATIVLVDSVEFETRLEDSQVQAAITAQVQAADLLLLNKIDCITDAQASALSTCVSSINPSATQLRCEHANVPVAALLDARVINNSGQIAAQAVVDDNFKSLSLARAEPLSRDEFSLFAGSLPQQVLRGKGLLRFSDTPDQVWLWQRVGVRESLNRWSAVAPDGSQLALIGVGSEWTEDTSITASVEWD